MNKVESPKLESFTNVSIWVNNEANCTAIVELLFVSLLDLVVISDAFEYSTYIPSSRLVRSTARLFKLDAAKKNAAASSKAELMRCSIANLFCVVLVGLAVLLQC